MLAKFEEVDIVVCADDAAESTLAKNITGVMVHLYVFRVRM